MMREKINIEKIYEIMSQRLFNISLRIVGNSADAEEIMHDTLLQYWKSDRKHEIIDIGKWLSSMYLSSSVMVFPFSWLPPVSVFLSCRGF